ncbi:MAG: MBL fold metallo-hydrolase [Thiobacillus sp.]|nr:MBL fold metallo-hydrolase [Thiobacillus sp.]
MRRLVLGLWLLFLAPLAQAFGLTPQRVAEDVYALIGPTGARTYENYGLNANFGFVVTPEGVVLIDSGASRHGAQVIERAVRTVTDKPIRWVINSGSQDHRWLGNDYFAGHGAQLIALARTVRTQQQFAKQHLAGLKPVLKDRLAGTEVHFAPKPIAADGAALTLGGVPIELHWYGDAHFPGDAMVWLPRQGVLFSGDLIYVDRMLGVLPWSRVGSWRSAFDTALATLKPTLIVPGHGTVCDAAKAQHDTGDYLAWLLGEIKPAAENWAGLETTVEKYSNESRWRYLENFEALHRGNINRSYVQFENNESGEVPRP